MSTNDLLAVELAADPLGLGLRGTAPVQPSAESAFAQGLRGGMRGAGSQLTATAGGVAEALGFNDAARGLYGTSRDLQAQAQRYTAPITNFRDVRGPGGFWDYATGLAGASLPQTAAALTAGLLTKGRGAGLAAGTAAVAPFNIGEAIQRQQADPTIAALPADQRLRTAAVTGTGQALTEALVPNIVAGKLLGHTAAQAGKTGLTAAVGRGLVDAGLEGVSEAAGTKIQQAGAGYLNPNRDTSGDNEELLQALVGGAAAGAPTAALGVAGEVAHGRRTQAAEMLSRGAEQLSQATGSAGSFIKDAAARARQAAGGAAEGAQSAAARVKEAAEGVEIPGLDIKPAQMLRELFTVGRQKADDLMTRMAEGREPVDEQELAGASPDAAAATLERADQTAMQRAQEWATRLMDDAGLDEARRAEVARAAQDLGDKTNRAVVAGIAKAREGAAAFKARMERIREQFNAGVQRGRGRRSQPAGDGDTLDGSDLVRERPEPAALLEGSGAARRSELSEGTRQAIEQAISPYLQDIDPELLNDADARNALADNLRLVVEMAAGMRNNREGVKIGNLPPKALQELRDVLGDNFIPVMNAAYEAAGTGDPAITERYFAAINQAEATARSNKARQQIVAESLTDEAKDKVRTTDLARLDEIVRAYASGDSARGMTREQAQAHDTAVRMELQRLFGDKVPAVLAAYERDLGGRQSVLERERAPGMDSDEVVEEEESQTDIGREGRLTERDDMVTARPLHDKPLDSPDEHKRKWGNEGQAERMIREAKAKNPGKNYRFVHRGEYAELMGLDPQARDAIPETQGFVVEEELVDPDRLSDAELASVRLSTAKTSHRESAARLDTGIKGERGNVIVDAIKLTQLMKAKLPYAENEGYSARTARAFAEGIAQLADKLGRQFAVPADTVIDRRGTTWGQAQSELRGPKGVGDGTEVGEYQLQEDDRSYDELNSRLIEVRAEFKGVRRALKQTDAGDEQSVQELQRAADRLVGEGKRLEAKLAKMRVDEATERRGAYEADPEDEIHTAIAAHGEDSEQVVRRTQHRGAPESIVDADGRLTGAGKEIVRQKIERLARGNQTQRALAEKAAAVLSGVDRLPAALQRRFALVGKLKTGEFPNGLATSEVARHINDAHAALERAAQKTMQPAAEPAAPAKLAAPLAARVDKIVTAGDYNALKTPSSTEAFLKAAKQRLAELQAEQKANDYADLPGGKQKVLSELSALFDAHSDLRMMFTELEGWGDVPAAEQARLLQFADSLTAAPEVAAQGPKGEGRLASRAIRRLEVGRAVAGSPLLGGVVESLKLLHRHSEAGSTLEAIKADPKIQLLNAKLMAARLRGDPAAEVLLGALRAEMERAAPFPSSLGQELRRLLWGGHVYRLGELMQRYENAQLPAGIAAVARAARKVAPDVPVSRDMNLGDGGTRGYFESKQGGIGLQVTLDAGHSSLSHTLLHEAVHAATVRAITSDRKLRQAMSDLMEHVVEHDPSLIHHYGLTNTMEFVAEAMTNEHLQRRLYRIPASDRVRAYLGDTVASAWEAFVGLVRKALNLAPEHDSALVQIIELAGQAMKRTAQDGGVTVGPGGSLWGVGTMVDGRATRALVNKALAIEGAFTPEGAQALRDLLEQATDREGRVDFHMSSAVGHLYDLVRNTGDGWAKSSPLGPDDVRTFIGDMAMDVGASAMASVSPGARFSQQDAVGPGFSDQERKLVSDYLDQVLGPKVKVLFEKLTYAGSYERLKDGTDLVRISTLALDPLSTAYHEGLHGFFQQLRDIKATDVMAPLYKAASTPRVMSQLRSLLAKEPAALRQIETDLEERVAYMYQFWANGNLEINGPAQGVLERVAQFFRDLLGMWSNDQRAERILEYFHTGQFQAERGVRGAVARATLESGTNRAVEALRNMAEPLSRLNDALMAMGDQRLRDTGNGPLIRLADMIYRDKTDGGEDRGFLPASRQARTEQLNQLAKALEGYSPEELSEALEILQGAQAGGSVKARVAARTVRKILDDTFDYMRAAGVNVADLGYGKDYFPRVWDTAYIADHQEEFLAMLSKYGDQLNGKPQDVLNTLLAANGNEFGKVTPKPGMQHVKERTLKFISDEDAAPFMRKNLLDIMNSYITQATRRAEWARRFGDDSHRLDRLIEEARRDGATDDDVAYAHRYISGVDGTLGDTIDPRTRRLFGNLIVYQNIRLLPLAIFSSVVDPLGVAVRGGTMGDAWAAFKRGVREVRLNFQKEPKADADTQLAELLGVVDNAMLVHDLSQTYTQGMVGDTARKINDAFFRYNLMEQWNRSMRVGATQAAIRFLQRHADGTASPHSTRWLAELGLRPGELVIKGGDLALTEADGLSPEQAAKVRAAINTWVDGAVLRPDAAHRPLWMNDPRFALFSHLKQFVYAFHETILKRVGHEIDHGNFAPLAVLASYVPVMIASDMAKDMIRGGGDVPEWKRNWGAGDYLWSGVERAGLLGVGQFRFDALMDLHRGGSGVGALSGPTLEQLADAVRVAGGRAEFRPFAVDSMPANDLYEAALK